MRIAVVGAGAMGSMFAYLAKTVGIDVVLYELRRERISEILEKGLRLRGAVEGGMTIEVKEPGEAAAPFDVLVMAVPAVEQGEALRPLSPFVHRETFYLSLQEGSAVEDLAGIVGEERAAGAISQVSAEEDVGGIVVIEEARGLYFGGLDSTLEEGLTSLVSSLAPVFPGSVELALDLQGVIWKRMESAAAVNALCSVFGEPPVIVEKSDEARDIGQNAARECRRAFGSGEGEPSPWEEAVWLKLRPPMLRDIEAGRPTEVEFLSGYVLQVARARGMSLPFNSALYSMVKELESGKVVPGELAFRELVRRVEEEKRMGLM